MNTLQNSRNRRQLGIPAILVVGAFTLGACSSGDDATIEIDKAPATTASPSESQPPETIDSAGDAVEATALLPVDADAPDGYTMVTARCDSTDAAANSDDATPTDVHRSGIVFAVPEAWSIMGSGSGGSGSVLGTDGDVEFDLESGDGVTVGYEWDAHTMDGEIADTSGQPWTSFDYDVVKADSTTPITYEKVATVTVGDQDVDLFYRDPSQAPDDLSTEQYVARISVAELPKAQMELDVAFVHSVVVTIEFGPGTPAVSQDIIETILSSYSMPTCSWEELLKEQELALQVDLNGDGKVVSFEDMQKELQDQLDALEQSQG